MTSPGPGRPDRARWWWAAGFATLLLGAPVLFGRALLFRDILAFFGPYHSFAAAALRQGRLPQWNPHVFGGMPFLADPQSAVFYPPNLLFLVLPPVGAATAFILLHLPVAALGAHYLARTLGIGDRFAALAGLGYATSGYLLGLHDNPQFLAAAALLPGAVALLVRLAQQPSGPRLVGAALGVALTALNGEPQTLAFACGAGVLLGVCSAPQKPRATGALVGAIALGAAVGAAQLLPTYLFAKTTVRGAGLPFAEASAMALHPLRLVEFLVASPLGTPFPENGFWGASLTNSDNRDPWTYCLFLGPAMVLPALGGRWWRSSARFKALAVLLVLSLLLAVGDRLPLFRLWHALVPLADRFRAPEKMVLWATLCLVLLSASELERLSKDEARRAWAPFAVAGAFAVACVVASLAPGLVLPAISAGLAREPYSIPADVALSRLLTTLAFSGLACAAYGAAVARARRPETFHQWLLGLAAVCGIWTSWNALSWGVPRPSRPVLADRARALVPPGAAGRLVDDGTCVLGGRALGEGQGTLLERTAGWCAETGYGLFPMASGLDTAWGYIAAIPAEAERVRRRVWNGPGGAYRWARLAGGAVRLGCDADGFAQLSPIPAPLPRAAVLPARTETRERILDLLDDPAFDFTSVALVSEPIAIPAAPEGAARTVEVVDESPEAVRVRVVSGGGLLVLADAYAHGWQASVDGKPAPVIKANALHRGVPVGPGEHEVVFTYRTPGLAAGAGISLTALLGCAALALVGRRRVSASSERSTS